MANIYKNAFVAMTTTNTNIYVTPTDSRALIQTLQVANDTTANINVDIFVTDSSVSANFPIAHDQLSAKETVNLAKGPIVLQEGDTIFCKAASNSSAHIVASILEINRNDQ